MTEVEIVCNRLNMLFHIKYDTAGLIGLKPVALKSVIAVFGCSYDDVRLRYSFKTCL